MPTDTPSSNPTEELTIVSSELSTSEPTESLTSVTSEVTIEESFESTITRDEHLQDLNSTKINEFEDILADLANQNTQNVTVVVNVTNQTFTAIIATTSDGRKLLIAQKILTIICKLTVRGNVIAANAFLKEHPLTVIQNYEETQIGLRNIGVPIN